MILDSEYEVFYENGIYIIKDINAKAYVRLNKLDYYFWTLLKSSDSIENVRQKLHCTNCNIDAAFDQLIFVLKKSNFINDDHSNPRKSKLKISSYKIDSIMGKIVSRIPRLLFNKYFFIILCFSNIVASIIYLKDINFCFDMSKYIGNYIFVTVWVAINILLHEVAHAIMCKHYNREILSAGFKLHYGLPAFFINTTDIVMTNRKSRILVSLAGPFVNWMLGSILVIFLPLTNILAIKYFLIRCISFSYLMFLFNLIPFFKLDGYYILSDIIGLRDLNSNSKKFILSWIKNPTIKFQKNGLMLFLYFTFSRIFNLLIILLVIGSIYNFVIKLIH